MESRDLGALRVILVRQAVLYTVYYISPLTPSKPRFRTMGAAVVAAVVARKKSTAVQELEKFSAKVQMVQVAVLAMLSFMARSSLPSLRKSRACGQDSGR